MPMANLDRDRESVLFCEVGQVSPFRPKYRVVVPHGLDFDYCKEGSGRCSREAHVIPVTTFYVIFITSNFDCINFQPTKHDNVIQITTITPTIGPTFVGDWRDLDITNLTSTHMTARRDIVSNITA